MQARTLVISLSGVNIAGARKESATGQFGHAGLVIDEYE